MLIHSFCRSSLYYILSDILSIFSIVFTNLHISLLIYLKNHNQTFPTKLWVDILFLCEMWSFSVWKNFLLTIFALSCYCFRLSERSWWFLFFKDLDEVELGRKVCEPFFHLFKFQSMMTLKKKLFRKFVLKFSKKSFSFLFFFFVG